MRFYTLIFLVLLAGLPLKVFAKDVTTSKSARGYLTYDDLSFEERAILGRGPINQGAAIAGGLASTFMGLGLGQAIQGRYSDTGWIFTLGEVGSLTVVILGIMGDCESTRGCHSNNNGMVTAGLIGYFGFRIWDAVDAWLVPMQINQKYYYIKSRLGEYGYDFSISPYPFVTDKDAGGGLAFKLTF